MDHPVTQSPARRFELGRIPSDIGPEQRNPERETAFNQSVQHIEKGFRVFVFIPAMIPDDKRWLACARLSMCVESA